jgi:hypothetical protein
MFLVLLTLALVGQAPIAPVAGPSTSGVNKEPMSGIGVGAADVTDKWFAIEYLGHFDGKHKFIFNRSRLLAPVVAGEILNYGLDPAGLRSSPTGVRGNDPTLQRKIDADVDRGRKMEAKVPPCGAIHTGPCPGPNCPKPEKPREPILPLIDPFEKPPNPMDHLVPVLIAVAVTTIFVGGSLIVLGGIAFALLRKKPPQ